MKMTDVLQKTHNHLYLQLLKDIKDLKSKQKEHHGVFESLRECIAYLTSTAGSFSILNFFTNVTEKWNL